MTLAHNERTIFAGVRLTAHEQGIIAQLQEAIGAVSVSDVIRLSVVEAAEARGLIPARPKIRRIRRDVAKRAA